MADRGLDGDHALAAAGGVGGEKTAVRAQVEHRSSHGLAVVKPLVQLAHDHGKETARIVVVRAEGRAGGQIDAESIGQVQNHFASSLCFRVFQSWITESRPVERSICGFQPRERMAVVSALR